MDPLMQAALALLALFSVIAALLVALKRMQSSDAGEARPIDQAAAAAEREIVPPEGGGAVRRRRATGMARMRRAAAAAATAGPATAGDADDVRTGAAAAAVEAGSRKSKKAHNREAKRDAQAAHAAALAARRERDADDEAARIEADEEAAAAEQAATEAAAQAAEEKAAREQAEYDDWKASFAVAEAGDGASAHTEEDDELLAKFVQHVRDRKLVVLEELAAEFDLTTEMVVDRIVRLDESGQLSGFFDDRGKYISVTMEEMEQVARFIQRRGRISIHDLAKESSRLLRLDSVQA